MMTSKEKAQELVDKYMNIKKIKLSDYSVIFLPTAKQCALIAVDEILWLIRENVINPIADASIYAYWQEVKQEIENL